MPLQLSRMIVMGKVGAPHGIEGAVKISSFTENPDDIFHYSPWYIKKKSKWVEVELVKKERQGKYLVAELKDCITREEAQLLTNTDIGIKRSQLPELPEGQYYWTDLEGLKVKTLSGVLLGIIDEIKETGANPVIVVVGEKRYLIPYLPHVVKEVDLALGSITVDWEEDF